MSKYSEAIYWLVTEWRRERPLNQGINMKKITPQELKNVIDRRGQRTVLDVRTLIEYLDFRIENIPFIPLELLDHIRQPEARWNKSKPVYVISYTEARSKAFCHKLETLGYRTFYIEEGEVESWCRKHLSVIDTTKNCRVPHQSALATTNGTVSNPIFNFKIVINKIPALGHYFRSIVGIAWFFEKINCNIKFVFRKHFNYFENFILKVSPESLCDNYIDLRLHMREFDRYYVWIASDYAYSVISRLTIKREIQEEADEWVGANLKGDWIGVHFRGGDLPQSQSGSKYDMDNYMSYLKKVIDRKRSIFVCSDQAQFIDRMSESFPGKVFSRDIQRSYDNKALHKHVDYGGFQQRKDALIDLLVLSNASLIYKAGGRFSYITRFFNPAAKTISFDSSHKYYCKYIPKNFVPTHKAYLLGKAKFLKHYYRKLHARLRNI